MGNNKKVLLVVGIVLVLCLCLVVCGVTGFFGFNAYIYNQKQSTSSNLPVQDTTDYSNNNQTNTDTENKIYGVNEVVKFDNKEITVLEVKDHKTTQKYTEPRAGFKYIAIKISEKNVGAVATYYSYLNYKLTIAGAAGQYYATFITGLKPSFAGGKLEKDKSMEGYMVFQIPETTKNADLNLEYRPFSYLVKGKANWNLAK